MMQNLLIQLESKLLLEMITDTVQNVEDIYSNFIILERIFLTIILRKERCVDPCSHNLLTHMGNATATLIMFQFSIRFGIYWRIMPHHRKNLLCTLDNGISQILYNSPQYYYYPLNLPCAFLKHRQCCSCSSEKD